MNTYKMEVQPKVYTECFEFKVDEYDSSGTNKLGHVGMATIIFKNSKFDHCIIPMSGTWNREQWRLLAAIEKRIKEIETLKETYPAVNV